MALHTGEPVQSILHRQLELLEPADLYRIDKTATLRVTQTIIQPLVAFQQAIDTLGHFLASLTNRLSSIG